MKIFPAKIDFRSGAIQSIIVTNIILIILAFILEWSIGELILMFWIENIILGLYGILKIVFFRGKPEEDEMTIGEQKVEKKKVKLILIPFFLIHFGIFCFVHGMFIDVLFGGGFIGENNNLLSWETLWDLKYGVLAILINYGVSFIFSYLGKGEFRTTSLVGLLFEPYRRIIVIHFIIMISGIIFIVFLSTPPAVLYVLFFFGVKMVLDLRQQSLDPIDREFKSIS